MDAVSPEQWGRVRKLLLRVGGKELNQKQEEKVRKQDLTLPALSDHSFGPHVKWTVISRFNTAALH